MTTNHVELNQPQTITDRLARGSSSCGNGRAQTGSKGMLEALSALYQLLEEYSPCWYTEELREKAQTALYCAKTS